MVLPKGHIHHLSSCSSAWLITSGSSSLLGIISPIHKSIDWEFINQQNKSLEHAHAPKCSQPSFLLSSHRFQWLTAWCGHRGWCCVTSTEPNFRSRGRNGANHPDPVAQAQVPHSDPGGPGPSKCWCIRSQQIKVILGRKRHGSFMGPPIHGHVPAGQINWVQRKYR